MIRLRRAYPTTYRECLEQRWALDHLCKKAESLGVSREHRTQLPQTAHYEFIVVVGKTRWSRIGSRPLRGGNDAEACAGTAPLAD